MAKKSYGTVLQRSGTTLGEISGVAVPEIIQDAAETTNHSSGGWRTFMPSGLKELGEFELTLIAGSSTFSTIYGDMTAESASIVYTVKYSGSGLGDWVFTAFPTSIKVEDMDAAKPEAMTLKVKFQASGSLTAS